ncbi:SDR family oxidoreductase [Litoreibacter roseus]|uniref:Short-chain dehydrogenase n=1 Tax=Litoreibacter roseus TaxID=2601869 RepID=A0A6N6JI76_9RHOB|nr:SDR family oxidoreductase [Litoreibacter roseus]GFE65647.1 short-chain dehydrogenase [Litoreibacter roseus]
MSKVILITGASSGIGAACARHAVKAGHKVALAARSLDKLNDLTEELGDDNALAIECDVTYPDQQKAMFDKAVEHFGQIDVVFANAGLGASAKGTENGDVENFKEMILVNNYGVTVTAKHAIPHLKKSGGHLILTGSKAGHINIDGSVYGATKWFIRGYADNLAAELSGTGARVTNINPGMVDTPFFDEEKPDALRPDDIARAFIYAIEQPSHVEIPSIQIYPK